MINLAHVPLAMVASLFLPPLFFVFCCIKNKPFVSWFRNFVSFPHNNWIQTESAGSTARTTSGASPAAGSAASSLRWDRQTIQFSVNAWVCFQDIFNQALTQLWSEILLIKLDHAVIMLVWLHFMLLCTIFSFNRLIMFRAPNLLVSRCCFLILIWH